jgi:predicted nucleotidyltransferase
MSKNFTIPNQLIAEFCRRNHISKLAVFGSTLRGDFSSDSDVDILVEFQKGFTQGFAFFRMQDELSELLGHKVDLHTPAFLSRYFRNKVVQEAKVQYAE